MPISKISEEIMGKLNSLEKNISRLGTEIKPETFKTQLATYADITSAKAKPPPASSASSASKASQRQKVNSSEA